MVILPSNTLIKVQVRSNESLDAALRRFKRQCNYAGIFRLSKKSSVYEKPSERRRRESRERVRNVQRTLRKANQMQGQRKRMMRRSLAATGSDAAKEREKKAGAASIDAVKPVPTDTASAETQQ